MTVFPWVQLSKDICLPPIAQGAIDSNEFPMGSKTLLDCLQRGTGFSFKMHLMRR